MTNSSRADRHSLRGDASGSAAVEFALLIGPLLFSILGIMEVSLHYFVSASIDHATHKVARLVRTGQAQELALTTDQLRDQVCQDVLNLFDCTEHSYISVETLTTLSTPPTSLPVDADGAFLADTAPQLGVGGDYVIVRGYFQFSPLFDIFGALTARLPNGNHIVVASALFRNEPF